MLLCSIYQRYKLKAIHNCYAPRYAEYIVVLNISKIQTESNSQPVVQLHVSADGVVLNISKIQTESNSQRAMKHFLRIDGCAQYIKDTN